MSLEDFGVLRTSSGIFGNDRVVFKNPSTPRIKISGLIISEKVGRYTPTDFIDNLKVIN